MTTVVPKPSINVRIMTAFMLTSPLHLLCYEQEAYRAT